MKSTKPGEKKNRNMAEQKTRETYSTLHTLVELAWLWRADGLKPDTGYRLRYSPPRRERERERLVLEQEDQGDFKIRK